MSQPNPEAISKFIDAYEKLASFEATTRDVRGYGAFSAEVVASFPIPECVEVYTWLKGLRDASV